MHTTRIAIERQHSGAMFCSRTQDAQEYNSVEFSPYRIGPQAANFCAGGRPEQKQCGIAESVIAEPVVRADSATIHSEHLDV
jgi:hypothetical protein